jgi:hypothetical protein
MFILSKWYCDCVSDDGTAFVGHWARMRWGLVTIPYAASLHKPVGEATRERYSIRTSGAPTVRDGELRWGCKRLGIRGTWTASAPGIRRTLLDAEDGSIDWHCHLPCTQASIELDGTDRISGLGYAEQLTLTVKPWRLPFEELRWGRFLSGEDAVTWIEQRGSEPRQWVFHNGSELRAATISTERVELPNDRGFVALRDAVVLREGRLVSTALRAIPAASVWLPRGIRNAHETKWLARGTFTTRERSSSGWVIHEVVRLR